jgi:hypothetical protein
MAKKNPPKYRTCSKCGKQAKRDPAAAGMYFMDDGGQLFDDGICQKCRTEADSSATKNPQ